LAATLFVVASCGGHTKEMQMTAGTPAPQLHAWADAVKRDDAHAAYNLLSPAQQKKESFDEFERRWKDTKPERDAQAAALEAGLRDAPSLGEKATVTLSDQKTTSLVHERGEWHMEAPLLGAARASSPQEALALFAAALEDRSVEGVMRLLTSTRRDGLNDQLTLFITGMKSHAGGEIQVTGDRATMQWNDGKHRWKITLRQENGEWRIDDFDVDQ
jgi:hypothetical protein